MNLGYRLVVLWMLAAAAKAQVTNTSSLFGKYFFREVAFQTNGVPLIQTLSGEGTLTFDGNGNYTALGKQIAGTGAATVLSIQGTYSVRDGGFVSISNPLLSGVTMNLRMGAEGLAGSSTEAGPNVSDLLIAIRGATLTVTPRALLGPYWVSSLEFPNGALANARQTNFTLTANGQGSFAETAVSGEAVNLGNSPLTQTVGPMTYLLNTDGSGTMNITTAPGFDATTQLMAGIKDLYVSADSNCFIAGSSAAGAHGIIVGIKQFGGQSSNSATNASWSGFYFAGGMRYDATSGVLTTSVGSVNPTSQGAVWQQHLHTSNGSLTDSSSLLPYSLNPDGSGTYPSTGQRLALSSNAVVFSGSGAEGGSHPVYELWLGTSAFSQSFSGPLPFLNPLGVFNAGTYAPPGAPVSPGGFVALFGTALASTPQTAGIPFPTIVGLTTLTVNGNPAPIYAITPTQINAVVPYGVSGPTATFVATVGNSQSNAVTVPLAATAPGVFSLAANGLGDGAITHADASATVVSQANPAKHGEIVQMYLTGLGAVNPPVGDGAAAPSGPLAKVVTPVTVTVGGVAVTNIQFQGLSPGLASLYQLNIQIPSSVSAGPQIVTVQTPDGSTSMVDVWVGN